MSWKTRVPTRYTDAQVKAMLVLTKHHIRYVSEWPLPLGPKEGVIADIILPDHQLRVECDDAFFHGKNQFKEGAMDLRIYERYGIRTVRLDNREILKATGERYVLSAITTEAIQ